MAFQFPVNTALLTAWVTALGWFISHVLQQHREIASKKRELHSTFLQRQIEELYGPLANIATQIVVTNHVLYGLVQHSKNRRLELEELFYFEYFLPLHIEARQLIKAKIHLAKGHALPESFYLYLKASMQEELQRRLWKEQQIDTSHVAGAPYPESFTIEVQNTLQQLLSDYDRLSVQTLPSKSSGANERIHSETTNVLVRLFERSSAKPRSSIENSEFA